MAWILPKPENETGPAEWADVYSNDRALKEKGEELETKVNATAKPLTWYSPKEIATEQSTSSATPVALSTPDEITGIVVPAGGIVRVGYLALWKSSVAGAARAAIFLDGTTGLANAPVPTGSVANNNNDTNFQTLSTFPAYGAGKPLATGEDYAGSTAGLGINFAEFVGISAGTHTISVRYAAFSGSVSAKERKLYVQVLGT